MEWVEHGDGGSGVKNEQFERRLNWAMTAAWFPHEMQTVHDYPCLPRRMPRWWQFRVRKRLKKLDTAFALFDLSPITQEMCDRFWSESSKGQSVYEDAGGYMMRCWYAAFSLPTDEPYTYRQAFSDLTEAAE
jgi:hypothetical protein